MPRIFEIFGYPIDDISLEAQTNRKAAKCPFMGRECDGGGNRYSSNIVIKENEGLEAFFGNREKVCAGVCSIQTGLNSAPWIVCPRRLLVLGREAAGKRVFQRQTEEQVLQLLDYMPGTRLGIWPEVKLKYEEEVERIRKTFDYTFDYILMPLAQVKLDSLEQSSGVSGKRLQSLFQKGGYTLGLQDSEYIIEDCPIGTPSIIEIMTSSTSGGNKGKGTTISGAFQDAILGRSHRGPGINYRQVWARMVSQLIVKSEVALGWNGKAIWVVQDVLVDYISRSTGLNVHKFVSEKTSEVNMLSFSFNEAFKNPAGVIELNEGKLFAGPISSNEINHQPTAPSFEDMIRTPLRPSLRRLIETLAQRKPVNEIVVP